MDRAFPIDIYLSSVNYVHVTSESTLVVIFYLFFSYYLYLPHYTTIDYIQHSTLSLQCSAIFSVASIILYSTPAILIYDTYS